MQTKTNPTLNIDWAMLREQKKQLIELQANPTITIHQVAALEGMVQMIDAIQDNAVDEEGVPCSEIFIYEDEADLMYAKLTEKLLSNDCRLTFAEPFQAEGETAVGAILEGGTTFLIVEKPRGIFHLTYHERLNLTDDLQADTVKNVLAAVEAGAYTKGFEANF